MTRFKQSLLWSDKESAMEKKQVKRPCIDCVYFTACGETTRTMPCAGRMAKTEAKKENEKK